MPTPTSEMYLRYIQQTGLSMRAEDAAPESRPVWEARRRQLRRLLQRSWGRFPKQDAPLEPRVVGQLAREGYRLEKILLQTWPGLTMSANAYVPDGGGPFPAVLCVHGHWTPAKQEPRVQARCIGLAKLGFFVLSVDAFGAGERGIGKQLGEYHGAMVASTLWPSGQALAGIQVYENRRAVDYLQSRPEVLGKHIGITGTSGGGNQTMYAAATDPRLRCVVPVCSVGSYQAYLGAACCMCELVPSAMTYTEEWAVLGLIAPRALMVINATRDAFQFSVGEARKSLARTARVFELYDRADHLRHVVVDSGHDYNRPMREAMYGWMALHLKGQGTGEPIGEPALQTEDPESIRCWPGAARPAQFVTLPQFAARRARAITRTNTPPLDERHWETERLWRLEGFQRTFRTSLSPRSFATRLLETSTPGEFRIVTEPGMTLPVRRVRPAGGADRRVILLDLERGMGAAETELARALVDGQLEVIAIDLRATGSTAPASDAIAAARDHNSAQWGMWVGRPLLVQWIRDLRSLLDALQGEPMPTGIIGSGPAGVVASCAAVADPRIGRLAALEAPLTLVSDQPFAHGRAGILVPGMLTAIGDIAQLLALGAPRPQLVAGGRAGDGKQMDREGLHSLLAYPRRVYELAGRGGRFEIREEVSVKQTVSWLAGKGTPDPSRCADGRL